MENEFAMIAAEKNGSEDSSFWAVIKKRKWLIIAATVAAVIMLLPTPDSVTMGGKEIALTAGGQKMLALLAFLIICFITEAFPLGAAIGVIYAWIVLAGVVPAGEAAKLFANDVNWFLLGALMIAAVLVKYKFHKRILVIILEIFGTKTKVLLFGLMAFALIASAFIADHTVAALLLPIAIAIVEASGGFKKVPNLAKLLLFGIAYSAAIGGLMTPSGGSRNIIMMGYLDQFYGVSMTFKGWITMAAPVGLLLLPIIWKTLCWKFKPEINDLKEVVTDIKSEMSVSRITFKEIGVLLIFLGILAMWVFGGEGRLGMIAILGGASFLILGFVQWSDYQDISWDIVLLYFAAIGLGVALKESGGATWVAAKGLEMMGSIIPLNAVTVTGFGTLMMTLVTELMADGPAVATVAPILLELAKLTGVDVVVFGMGVAIASSFAFMLVIATPPNAIIYSSGYLKAKDFLKAGGGIILLALPLLWFIMYFWWGWLGVGVNGFH
ncbi:MAG: DASS family sodium-coupled anion symporter [bacterium]|nr:DASS family sodium-coupled anion symporter [bacterium]